MKLKNKMSVRLHEEWNKFQVKKITSYDGTAANHAKIQIQINK